MTTANDRNLIHIIYLSACWRQVSVLGIPNVEKKTSEIGLFIAAFLQTKAATLKH